MCYREKMRQKPVNLPSEVKFDTSGAQAIENQLFME